MASGAQRKPAATAAYVEEYDSEDNEPIPGTRLSANKSSGKPAIHQVNGDGHSDSGYSSHTAATVNSADSSGAPSQNQEKRFTLPQRISVQQRPSSSSASRSRPSLSTDTGMATERPQKSPRKPSLKTSGSRSPRKPLSNPDAGYGYEEYTPEQNARQSSPLDAPWNIDYTQFNTGQPRRSPVSPHVPSQGYPVGYSQEAPLPTPRPRTSSSSKPRPSSFHQAGRHSVGAGYGGSSGYGPVERGPPPSQSAYANPILGTSYPPAPGAGYMQPVPRADYAPGYAYPPTAASPVGYPLQSWSTDPYAARPAQSAYTQPSPVDYDYSYQASSAAMPITKRAFPRSDPSDNHPSYSVRSDATLMPPPTFKPRPRISHTTTEPVGRDILRPSSAIPRESIPVTMPGLSRTRSQSTARPSTTRKSASYQNGEAEERRRRRSSAYYNEEERPTRARERELTQDVEAYQEEVRRSAPAAPIPLTAEAVKKAGRRASAKGSAAPPPRSNRSSGSGSSEGRKTTGTRDSAAADGSVTMRFKQGQNVKLDFSGADTEGRTLNLRPSEDGNFEISINGSNKKYVDGSSGTRSEYARSTGSRRGEERLSRDQRSDRRSRRSSRGGDRY